MNDQQYPWQNRQTLSTKEAVEYMLLEHEMKRSVQTLNTWRHKGLGPTFYKRNGEVFYRKEDIDTWVSDKTSPPATSTSKLPNPRPKDGGAAGRAAE